MKRARSSITPPTLQSVDPIDLRALSDELDLSDLMRRTVISTIDEWAETPPVSASNNVHTPSPPPKSQINQSFDQPLAADMDSHPPNSPVRLWASIRRLWQAVFPGEPDIHQEHRGLDTRFAKSPEIIRTPHVPQPTHHSFEHPTRAALNFEEDVGLPSQPLFEQAQAVKKVETEHTGQPAKPLFEEPAQAAKLDTEHNAKMRRPLFEQPTQAAPKLDTAQNGRMRQPLFEQPTQTVANIENAKAILRAQPLFEQSTQHVAKVGTAQARKSPESLFQQPTRAAPKFESPHSRQPPQPLFQQPTLAAARFETTHTEQPPQLLFQRPVQPATRVETAQISKPSQHPPKLFTDFPQPKKPPLNPYEASDFFDADLKEEDVELDLPSDNELLDLCSRLTSPSQQSQRRRITGDPAIDRRLAHLESLRQHIRQRRENDKDADVIRHRRRQRLIEEQRKISSSLRVQRVSNVPRNVKLPVPTRRSRLARVKDARARGGVSSPTGIFEGATRFQY